MTLVLHLEDQDAEVLDFILGVTEEKWRDQKDGQLELMTYDPSLKTLEDLTEAAGGYSELLDRVQRMRDMLNTKGD